MSIIRKLEQETGFTLTILQDLSGPKVRTCDVGQGTLEISKGTEVLLGTPDMAAKVTEPFICLDMPELQLVQYRPDQRRAGRQGERRGAGAGRRAPAA